MGLSHVNNYSRVNVGVRDNAGHVMPGQRHSPFLGRMTQNIRQPSQVDNCRRVPLGYRESCRSFGIREAGYIPFLGIIIGICNIFRGVFLMMHFTSEMASEGFSLCGRGFVEMVPVLGGITLYFYDRK